jgi:GDP-4-dehydro-6-deoxy-D-mannose reductase
MRALITGINGFVGSSLADYLLAQGRYELWGLSRAPGRLHPRFHGRIAELHGDLTDRQATQHALSLARPDLIFHLAGQPFVPESFRDPAATLQINILGALHLFQAILELQCPARVLVIGSYEEYGKISDRDLPIHEQCPLRPTNPYGVSKAAQGLLALQYHLSHGIDTVRVRPFNHIGPGQSVRFVAAAFAQQIARIERGLQPPIVQVGNLSARRDLTDVRDTVRAYALLAEHGQSGAVYNVGSGQAVMMQALLDQLLALSSIAVEVRPDPERMRPIDIPTVVCDRSLIHAQTGWEPAIPLQQTLRDILDYWRGEVSATLGQRSS